MTPLKFAAYLNRDTLPESTPEDFSFTYVDIGAVSLGRMSVPDDEVAFAQAPSRARRLAPTGATVIATVRTYLRAVARVPRDGLVFSTGFCVAEAQPGVDPDFLYYACTSEPFIADVVARSTGVSYPAINPSDLGQITVPLPSPAEQRRIADFLGVQVGVMDRAGEAILEQIRLQVARLAALIDIFFSPVDDAMPLGRGIRAIEQGWSPQCEAIPSADNEWGVTKVGAVKRGRFVVAENKRLPDDLVPVRRYELKGGELLVSRANTPNLVGDAAVVPAAVRPRLLLCDKLMRVTLEPSMLDAKFVAYSARTSSARSWMSSAATGTSDSMVNIRGEDLKSLRIRSVPIAEQHHLVAEVVESEAVHDEILSAVDAQLQLLEERKRALITACVTGEFDVSSAGNRAAGAAMQGVEA